jgi:hypothetical protein
MSVTQQQAAKILPLAVESGGFFVSGVTEIDGTHTKQPIDVSPQTLCDVADAINQGVAQAAANNAAVKPVSFMLIGVGPKRCTVLCHVAPTAQESLRASDWMTACGIDVDGEASTGSHMIGYREFEFAIKGKDMIVGAACGFLRAKKLLVDEEEEHVPFNINDD